MSACAFDGSNHDGRSTKMFRKSLLAAALLAGTSLGAMAGTVTPVKNAFRSTASSMGSCSPTAPFSFRAACCRISTASSRTSKGSYVNGTLYPAASPAAELHSLRHLGRRPAGRARALDWRGVYAAGRTTPSTSPSRTRWRSTIRRRIRGRWSRRLPVPIGISSAIRRGRSFPTGICCSGRSLPRLWPSSIPRP